MATLLEAALPYLAQLGGNAGGLSGWGGLANALGGGAGGFGSVAGSPMAGAMQGPTQGSGLMGALSGGGMGAINNTPNIWSSFPHSNQSPSSNQGIALTNPLANIKLAGLNASTGK